MIRRLAISLAVLAVALLLAGSIEMARCRANRLPVSVEESDLATLNRVYSTFGAPSARWQSTRAKLAGQVVQDVTLPQPLGVGSAAEPLLVSVWERRCFCVGVVHFVVVSRVGDGVVLAADGGSRLLFQPVMVRHDSRRSAGPSP